MRHKAYHALVQIHAVERWLDEGWTPWRIGYGAASLLALAVTVYAYAEQPHHPGAVWWLLTAVAVVATWALGEMLRWRIKYRRLVAAQQEASAKPPTQPISKLVADGKELQADIGSHMSWWGTDRLLPRGVPGRIVRWESNVSDSLINLPDVRSLFHNAPDIDVNNPISGQAYGRLEYELKILESAISDSAEGSTFDSDQSAVARAEAALATYYTQRMEKLHDLHEQGTQLLKVTNSSAHWHLEAGSTTLRRTGNWEAGVVKALMYWPDLNKFGTISTIGIIPAPSTGELHERIEQELLVLQTAIERLQQ
jgi:hypothetical protein